MPGAPKRSGRPAERRLPVPTDSGHGSLVVEAGVRPAAVVLLGHGAGGGVEAPDLLAVRDALVADGIAVARFVQPYRVAGQRSPQPAPKLDAAWLRGVAALRAVRGLGRVPLVAGGRSSGARVACRTAAAAGAVGVVALAFPLAPPGRPERTRAAELLDVGVPVLVVQGERDAFGSAADVRAASASAPSVRVVTVPGADHGFRARRADGATTAECLVEVAAAVRAFVHALVG